MLASESKEIVDRFIPKVGVTPLKEFMSALFAEMAGMFQVERIGNSRMEADRSAIQHEVQYSLADDRCDTRCLTKLHAKDYPGYFDALESSLGVVVSHDVMRDERLADFWADCFPPLGITSMLDVPVIRTGKLFGLICHEHVGPLRTWPEEEVDAACGFGHLGALAVETDERHQAERALRISELAGRRSHL